MAHRYRKQPLPWLMLWLLFAAQGKAQVWTSIGPSPISGNNGATGRITSLAVDPSNPNHWLLGSAGGGVWNSAAAATSWTPLTDAQASLSIGAVAFAPSNPQILYAGTGEPTYAAHAQAGQGILKSTDGGATWTLMGASTFARTAIGAIRVNPSHPNIVEAAMARASAGRDSEPFLGPYPSPFGVQLSNDGGVTWTLTLPGESTTLEIDPTNFNNQFTAISLPSGYGPYYTPAASGVYRSADGGQTWTLITGPWSGQTVGRIVLSLAPSSPNTLYASVQGSNSHLLGLFRTDNASAATPTWIQVSTSGNWSTLGSSYTDYCGSSCTSMDLIAIDPSDPNTLYAGGASLWRCSSCGATPTWTDIGYSAQRQGSIPSGKRCLTWAGSLMIACTDGGLFSTATGTVPWQDQNGGLSVARLVSGALHPTISNSALAGAFDNATALWTGALAWQSLQVGNAEVALSASQPNTGMMTSSGETIYRSTNGGQTFVGANGGFTSTSSSQDFLPVRKCPLTDDVFLTGTTLVQRSNNFFSGTATSWSADGPSGSAITAIAFAPSDATCNTYAYGTTSGQVQMTVNGGGTWKNLDPNGNLPGRAVNSLAFDPTTTNTVYAALGGFNAGTAVPGHLFKTASALSAVPGWSDMSAGADLPFNVVVVDPANPSSIYIGTDAAVWHSSNGGSGWQFLGPITGLPNVPVYDLRFSAVNDTLFAFTFGRGAWTLDTQATPATGPLVSLSGNSALPATLGSPFGLTLSAAGTPPYAYSIGAGALPSGLVLLPSGTIQGTPLDTGVFTFTVLVTDANGGVASQTYTMTVGTTGISPVWTDISWTGTQNGRLASIAVDPADPNHWLAGFGNGGVWEAHDGGGNWLPLSDNWPTLATGASAFAPSDPKTIYVGTGEADVGGLAHTGIGVMKSTDGGMSWTLLASASFARGAVKKIRVHPTDANTVVAATTRSGMGRDALIGVPSSPPFGVLRSTDGGVTWTRTLIGQATALEVHPANFNNQYAAIGDQSYNELADSTGEINGIYRSTDGGRTWALISGPWGSSTATTASVGRVELAISPSNPNTLYASIQVPPNGGTTATGLLGLYRTDNAWDPTPTWIQVPVAVNQEYCNVEKSLGTGITTFNEGKCGYAHVISVDPSDPDTLFAGGVDLWLCKNCANTPTWTDIDTTVAHPGSGDYHVLIWSGSLLICGDDHTISSSADGGQTWQLHSATLSTMTFYNGVTHPSAPGVVLTGVRDLTGLVLRSESSGWQQIVGQQAIAVGEGDVGISSTLPDTDWIGGDIWGAFSRTTDGGQTWIAANAGIDTTYAAFVAPVRKCPSNDNVVLNGASRLWRSDNFFGTTPPTWVPNGPQSSLKDPLFGIPPSILEIEFVASDTTCNTYVYGNSVGQVQLTRDGGNTWVDLDPGKTLPPRPINGLAYDPTNPNVFYAALSSFDDGTPGKPGHVFKTTNALTASPAWSNASPPLNQPFNVIRVDPSNPNLIYAGADTGLWRSTDHAMTWVQDGLQSGFPNASVYDIKINPDTGTTVAFTYGRGAHALGPELLSVTASADGGATYAPGPLVPGAWARVEGAQLSGVTASSNPDNPPANLDGVEVRLNGVSAAIYSVSPAQIAFQVPASPSGPVVDQVVALSRPLAVTIQVLRGGVPSNNLIATLAPVTKPKRPR